MNLPSDHAPISLTSTYDEPEVDLNNTIERANNLGQHGIHVSESQINQQITRKSLRMNGLNKEALRVILEETPPPDFNDHDTDSIISTTNDILYDIASRPRQQEPEYSDEPEGDERRLDERWRKLVDEKDSRELWKAINWNGTLDTNNAERPSDEVFREHFESLLNPEELTDSNNEPNDDDIYLPVTDDPIQPQEVLDAIQSLKANKSGGPSGIPPGLLKLMPARWIVFLATLFSILLTNCTYPCRWTYTKLIILFKKGSRDDCGNYRGISLMDSIAKLYDIIINRRLCRWFTPDREQAGSTKGRGCLEHIISLRLLIDYAKCKKAPLFIVYVDFSKAYDRVPRNLLIEKLNRVGCGTIMKRTIAKIYSSTKMMLRTAVITATLGVRQGSPTSCFLFTLFTNDLIRSMKTQCGPDGYLGWLHTLMLMDDTVILATTRERAIEKVKILKKFCDDSGMLINESKTKFMVVNGNEEERRQLEVDSISIDNCEKYCYFGCMFTQDAKIRSAVKEQCRMKMAHVTKYEAFVRKNPTAPYEVKEKVFTAALTSAMLYGVESWLNQAALEEARPMYTSCIRSLLGVRKTTAGDLCLVEAGQPTLTSYAKNIQKKAIQKLIQERSDMDDDPFHRVWQLANEARTPGARYIQSLENFDINHEAEILEEKIRTSTRMKYRTYVTLMNPELNKNTMYMDAGVKEHERIVTTKFRLSSQNFKI